MEEFEDTVSSAIHYLVFYVVIPDVDITWLSLTGSAVKNKSNLCVLERWSCKSSLAAFVFTSFLYLVTSFLCMFGLHDVNILCEECSP